MIVRIWLITVTVPVKLMFVFPGAALNVNDPDPVPLAPEVIVSHVALGTADQTHPV
jgi:hypothetical protein